MENDYGKKEQMQYKEIGQIEGVHTCKTVTSLKDLTEIKGRYKLDSFGWIFRGQKCACRPLSTTLEREIIAGKMENRWKQEAVILREFTRRVHHYVAEESVPKSTLEWFALMRHYGAPCRLLDCTYSFYVAEFFALRNLNQMNRTAAIWAINRDWLRDCRNTIFGNDVSFKYPQEFYEYFLNHEKQLTFASEVNPFRINQRLTAQQGVFLCPGDVRKSFMENLVSMAKIVNPSTGEYGEGIIRIPIASDIKTTLIRELHQMNINSATLFPDLTGFAESLSQWFHMPDTIIPHDDELVDALRNEFPDERQAPQNKIF